jgi:hypothetical protein
LEYTGIAGGLHYFFWRWFTGWLLRWLHFFHVVSFLKA